MAAAITDLQSPDLHRREAAAVALENFHPLPPSAIAALAEAITREETLQRTNPDDGLQLLAYRALSNAGAGAVVALAKLAESPNDWTRERALKTLGDLGVREQKAWPILIAALRGPSHDRAAISLSKIGPPILPVLCASLCDSDPRVRSGAARALAEMGTSTRNEGSIKMPDRANATFAELQRAKLPLTIALHDEDIDVRNLAAIALAWIAPDDSRPIPILLNLMQGEDSTLGYHAAHALESMKAGAASAAPALERILSSQARLGIRVEAAHALASSIGIQACGPLAEALVTEKDDGVRTAIIAAMAHVAPPCPRTLPELIARLGTYQQWVKRYLSGLGEPAVPALVKALQNPDVSVREDAIEALAQMQGFVLAPIKKLLEAATTRFVWKPLPPAVVNALKTAEHDPNEEVRTLAQKALAGCLLYTRTGVGCTERPHPTPLGLPSPKPSRPGPPRDA